MAAIMTAPRYESPHEAEQAFYEAFQSADLDAMRAVWANHDEIVCVHPMGPRLQGREAVLDSWRDILGSGTRLTFRVDHSHVMAAGELSVHCVHENISQGPQGEIRGLVIATNIYRESTDGWRMVLHHGSPATVEAVTRPPSTAVH